MDQKNNLTSGEDRGNMLLGSTPENLDNGNTLLLPIETSAERKGGFFMGTLSTAIKEWLELEKKYDVKTGTYDRLVISYKLMLHYGIASIPMESVTASDVKGYLNSLVEAGYALSTIKKQYRLLTSFYAWAFDRGVITVNVTTGVKLPKEEKVQKHAREIVAYTMPQQKALLNTLHTLLSFWMRFKLVLFGSLC